MTSDITPDNLANLENAQRWIDLLDTSKRYLNQNPIDFAIGYYYQGIAYHELKQMRQADEMFTQANKLDNQNPLFFNAKGLLLKDQKQYPEAILQFESATRINPDLLNPLINKAQTLSLQNKNEEALVIYNSVLSKNPDLVPVLIFRGECLKELGRSQEALQVYDRAIQLEPSAADLIFNKGNILAQDNDFERAKSCYQKAAELDPQFADSFFHLGLVNQKLGKVEEAASNYRQAINLDSPSPLSHVSLADLYLQSDQRSQGERTFEQCLERFPDSPFGHYNYGLYKLSQGRLSDSTQDFLKAISCLDEPEGLKVQLQKTIDDNQKELNRVSNLIPRSLPNSQQISINYPGLTDNLLVKKENQSEIISNIKTLKTRIWSLETSATSLKSLDDDLVHLQQKSPLLYEYVVTLLSFQNNFLINSQFDLPMSSQAMTSVNLLRNFRDLPSLMCYTSGTNAFELILTLSGNKSSQTEFSENIRKTIIANKQGFNSEETLLNLTKIVLKKVQNSESKLKEILNYDSSEAHKKFTSKAIKDFPKIKPDLSSRSTAVALKDFVLINNYFCKNSQVSEFSKNNYDRNFENVYGNDLYEDSHASKLQTNVEIFQSFKGNKNRQALEVVVSFDNKNKATSKSALFIQVFLSLEGPTTAQVAPNNSNFKEVYVSPAHVLENLFDFSFDIDQTDLKMDFKDKTFLKIVVLKVKEDKSIKKKGEQWIALNKLHDQPQFLMDIKQKKMFSSKQISISVRTIQH